MSGWSFLYIGVAFGAFCVDVADIGFDCCDVGVDCRDVGVVCVDVGATVGDVGVVCFDAGIDVGADLGNMDFDAGSVGIDFFIVSLCGW